MSNSMFDKLSLGAINSTVTAFKNLVEDHASSTKNLVDQHNSSNIYSINNSEDIYTKFNATVESIVTEFDFDLYSKALKLPECQNISFSYNEDIANNLIGTFTGSKIFKDFNGTIKADTGSIISQITNQIGKIIIDSANTEYAIFTNNSDISEIISLSDFNSKPLVNDFSDLYQTLLNNKFSKLENYTSDTKSFGSLFTSFSEYTTDDITGSTSSQMSSVTGDLIDNTQSQWNPVLNDIFLTIDSFKNIVIPDIINSTQINLSIPNSADKFISTIPSSDGSTNLGSTSDIDKDTSDLSGKEVSISTNNINPNKSDSDSNSLLDQTKEKLAHIASNFYDTIDIAQVQATITYDGLKHMLKCWQQPESISYSASAQFDGIPSRGTQQPFQFYNCANQITLGFELKWHIDELDLYKSKYKTLQEIADIAEDFTRPYENGDSLMPKLCVVSLPSLSEIGYITEAQISYGGAITGTANQPYSHQIRDVTSDNQASIKYIYEENNLKDIDYKTHISNKLYQYSTLTINFQLLIVKDIKLSPSPGVIAATEAFVKAKQTAAKQKTAESYKQYTSYDFFGPERMIAPNQSLNSSGLVKYISNVSPILQKEPKSKEQVTSITQLAYEAILSNMSSGNSTS